MVSECWVKARLSVCSVCFNLWGGFLGIGQHPSISGGMEQRDTVKRFLRVRWRASFVKFPFGEAPRVPTTVLKLKRN